MKELAKLLREMLGDRFHVTPEVLAGLVLRLAPVALDLADGDAHLSPENRLKIQEAVMELRGEVEA